ncbi:hypothetical protein E4U13_005789 [Claviceps humidiphila]|uniref:Uncharacterized protein n=1 Tax=Claviceps humidiphila TaxID=1294629 RepID=A0A9P7PWL0_9HYPO|nr:hypothetical protein E4U13_005789 [Claviceps humidiphila]
MRTAARTGLLQPPLSLSPPSPGHGKPMPLPQKEAADPRGASASEDANLSDETFIEHQDEAQAALQPAISAAASHLTSCETSAAEKKAALRRLLGREEEDDSEGDGNTDADEGDSVENEAKHTENSNRVGRGYSCPTSSPQDHLQREQQHHEPPEQLPMPTPWTVNSAFAPNPDNKDSSRTHHAKSILQQAFNPTRQHRSLSAGQEAFRKLQKALPSFGGHTSFFPSLPASFMANFTGGDRDNKQASHSQGSSNVSSKLGASNVSKPGGTSSTPRPRSMTFNPLSTSTSDGPVAGYAAASEKRDKRASLPGPPRTSSSPMSRPRPRPRPSMLRRVTSDESMLYHSLSRQSSLGDDNKFHDVREMVNIRFMAIKDSLPDVPNFKMPSLARLHAVSRMSSVSLNGLFSSTSDTNATGRQGPEARRQPRNSSPLSSSKTPSVSKPASPTKPTSSTAASSATSAIDRVLEKLTGDIVILGGYRGSVLRSAEPPHQQLWAPVKLGFNMRKANLEVGLQDEDELTMEERIVPSGMLKHVGPVDISKKLFKKLRSSPNARNGTLRVWDFGYDWRLSPALSSEKLRQFLAQLPSNRPGIPPSSRGALVVAHSLGGLVTRHAVNQAPDLFSGVLYAGVPQRCINILGPLRNGDAVLFNEKLLNAQVNFSIRTSFALLPDDGFCFIDKDSGESYPVDFFDADNWARWHLSPCVASLLPPYNRDKQQGSFHSPLVSLLPNSLLRSKKPLDIQASGAVSSCAETRENQDSHAPFSAGVASLPSPPLSPCSLPPDTLASGGGAGTSDRERYMQYLRRTLAATRQFRDELAHREAHESANVYPPHAVLYGKTIPTVYAAQVSGREAIAYADAYDDLVFRPGDGVVLAREAMLPEGYALVRSGRVSTERGHLTMLGDLPSVAKALEALLWGRQKGIGMGRRDASDEGGGKVSVQV